MKLLLDAHALLWFLADSSRLSAKARTMMIEPGNELLLSIATCWEIAVKVSIGKLVLTQPFRQFIDAALPANQIEILPIHLRHLFRVAEMPFHHRDPFDRLLAAQSLEERLTIVSIDDSLDAYGVTRVW